MKGQDSTLFGPPQPSCGISFGPALRPSRARSGIHRIASILAAAPTVEITALLIFLGTGVAAAPATEPRAASLAAQVSASGAGHSFAPAFSADGRFVVFVSHANNLVTNDDLGLNLDVFVRDLTAGTTTLVSVNASGSGGGDGDSHSPAISSNGQFVAFASAAGDLVPGDTNHASDIFVRDRLAGTTTLASVDRNGAAPAAAHPGSRRPLFSADGRWVFFESTASTLTTNADGPETRDVFARDLVSGVTHLVSVNQAGTGGLSWRQDSELCSISADGRFVAFVSKAPDLVPAPTSTNGDVFVRDMQAGVTLWAGTNVPALLGIGSAVHTAHKAVLSADGCCVAFKTGDTTGTSALFWHNLQVGTTRLIATDSHRDTWPEISADGRFILFEDGRFGPVDRHDATTGSNVLVGIDDQGLAITNPVLTLAMTPDGRNVLFQELPLAGTLPTNLGLLYLRDATGNTTRVVSVGPDGSARPVGDNVAAALRSDGQLVAFDDAADGWVTNDFNDARDVFVHDLAAGTTRLVSEHHAARPIIAGGTLAGLGPNCLSADGRVLVFTSYDSALTDDDTNRWQDVFVRDLMAGTNTAIPPGWYETNGSGGPPVFVNLRTHQTGAPSVSADGRFVLFVTEAWDVLTGALRSSSKWRRYDRQTGETELIVPESYPPFRCRVPRLSRDGRLVAFEGYESWPPTIYLRDLATRRNYLVVTDRSGIPATIHPSADPVLSPDDRWISFLSQAWDLTTNLLTSTNLELYAREVTVLDTNVQFGPTRLISHDGPAALGCAGSAVFSPDTRCLAFVSTNAATVTRNLYLHDLATGTTTLVASNANTPSVSQGGRWIAYQTWQPAAAGPFTNQIVVADTTSGTNELVSVNRAGTGAGNGPSSSPLITPNGRYVVFASGASDLVEDDANGVMDLFVRDRNAGVTFALSRSWRTGGTAAGVSSHPFMSSDDRTVVFQSFAGDVAEGDFNDTRDVFVVNLGLPDSDGDGLDDDWEMAYFDTLGRDGTGGFDGDGASDRHEFLAGTDPTNRGSVFRVLTVQPLGGDRTMVLWSAVTGRNYKVQFKDTPVDPEWTDVSGTVVPAGATAWFEDQASRRASRYYRVVLIP